MIDLALEKEKLNSKNPNLPVSTQETLTIIYMSSFTDSFGEDYLQALENTMLTTSYETGSETGYRSDVNLDGTYSKTITIRNDFNGDNINHLADLTESAIASMCDHWSKEDNTIINNRGLATTTYDTSSGEMVKTSSLGTGLQEGLESYLEFKTIRDNYSDSYQTTNCIYQETVARWLMENGFKDDMLLGAFTGNTTNLKSSLTSAEIDYDVLLEAVDKLKEAEQARRDGKITPSQVQEIFVGISPILGQMITREKVI